MQSRDDDHSPTEVGNALYTEEAKSPRVWEYRLSSVRPHLVGYEESFTKAVDEYGPTRVAKFLSAKFCRVTRMTVMRIYREVKSGGAIKVPGVSVSNEEISSTIFDKPLEEVGYIQSSFEAYEKGAEQDPSGGCAQYSEPTSEETPEVTATANNSRSGGAKGDRPLMHIKNKQRKVFESGAVSDVDQQRIIAEKLQLKDKENE